MTPLINQRVNICTKIILIKFLKKNGNITGGFDI